MPNRIRRNSFLFAIALVPLLAVLFSLNLAKPKDRYGFLHGALPSEIEEGRMISWIDDSEGVESRTYYVNGNYSDFVREASAELEPQGYRLRSQRDGVTTWIKGRSMVDIFGPAESTKKRPGQASIREERVTIGCGDLMPDNLVTKVHLIFDDLVEDLKGKR